MIQFYERDLEDMMMEALSGKTTATLADRGFHFLDDCLQHPHRVERQSRVLSENGHCIIDIALFVDAPDAKRIMLIELKRDTIDYTSLFQSLYQRHALENRFYHDGDSNKTAYVVSSCIVGASIMNSPRGNNSMREFDLALSLAGVDVYTYGFGFDAGLAFKQYKPNLKQGRVPPSSPAAFDIERRFPTWRSDFGGAPTSGDNHVVIVDTEVKA